MNRLFPILLLLVFLVCRLEWAKRAAFLYEVKLGFFSKKNGMADGLIHPAILLPLAGQLLLLFTLFQKRSSRKLIITGICLLGLLVLFILLAGILGKNAQMILSTLPFVGLGMFYILSRKKTAATP